MFVVSFLLGKVVAHSDTHRKSFYNVFHLFLDENKKIILETFIITCSCCTIYYYLTFSVSVLRSPCQFVRAAEDASSYGSPSAPPSTSYGIPLAEPLNSYEVPLAEPLNSYGVPLAEPLNSYDEDQDIIFYFKGEL